MNGKDDITPMKVMTMMIIIARKIVTMMAAIDIVMTVENVVDQMIDITIEEDNIVNEIIVVIVVLDEIMIHIDIVLILPIVILQVEVPVKVFRIIVVDKFIVKVAAEVEVLIQIDFIVLIIVTMTGIRDNEASPLSPPK